MNGNQITLGTRGSELALKQTTMVTALLNAADAAVVVERKIIHTAGDKRPDLKFSEFSQGDNPVVDKGIFIKELEIALQAGEIDAAVHSLKDVPSELGSEFVIAAVLERAPIEDVLISRGKHTIDTLPKGARVGTSSVRRARQLTWLRPDLDVVQLRGNVPTRLRKCLGEGGLDAIMLAAAGLLRLDLLDLETSTISIDNQTLHAQVLDPVQFYPAAGQGAIAIEARAGDQPTLDCLAKLNHAPTALRITVEREFLTILGAGCQTPVGARTWIEAGQLHMSVRVFSETDLQAEPREATASGPVNDPLSLARQLAREVQE
jgi:hydroxymethylbilane synthase